MSRDPVEIIDKIIDIAMPIIATAAIVLFISAIAVWCLVHA
jgi:hypothetical protein